MATGDHIQTAISVSNDCDLITTSNYGIIDCYESNNNEHEYIIK